MTTATIPLEVLKAKCNQTKPDEMPPNSRWMTEPHPISLDDGPEWTFATTGQFIVAVPGVYGCPRLEREKLEEMVREWLTKPKRYSAKTTLAELLAQLQIKPVSDEDDGRYACQDCYGVGSKTCVCMDCDNEHYTDCKGCRGTGFVGVRRIGEQLFRFAGEERNGLARIPLVKRHVDAWCVFRAVQGLPEGPIRIEYDDNPTGHLRIVADGWKAIVMPLTC